MQSLKSFYCFLKGESSKKLVELLDIKSVRKYLSVPKRPQWNSFDKLPKCFYFLKLANLCNIPNQHIIRNYRIISRESINSGDSLVHERNIIYPNINCKMGQFAFYGINVLSCRNLYFCSSQLSNQYCSTIPSQKGLPQN